MAEQKKAQSDSQKPKKENLFQKLSLFVFAKYRLVSLIMAALVIAGGLAYGVFLKREGFPPIQTPISLATGAYFVEDAELIDEQILTPVSDKLLEKSEVTGVQTSTDANFFTIFTQFEESVSAEGAAAIVQGVIDEIQLPDQAQIQVPVLNVTKYLNKYTILLAVYTADGADLRTVQSEAEGLVDQFNSIEGTVSTTVLDSFSRGVNPVTGEETEIQTGYSRFGENIDGEIDIVPSVLVGLETTEDTDALDYSELVNQKIDELMQNPEFEMVKIAVAADVAPSVEAQISSLQSNLLTGLLAVSLISFLLITWRASVITAVFMVSVVSVTLLILYAIGYSLNTISLFALVLALGLFVDDATIIVEAIDAGKAKKLKPAAVVKEAIGKVGAASFAGTFTTVLVFLPMAFISGILGSFIRILPVTIIVALITSLFLSLTLIPVLSKYILLNNDKKSWSPLGKLESAIARKISSWPLVFRKSRRKGWLLTTAMISISVAFFALALNYASLVKFNIFPSSKDSDQLIMSVAYPRGTTIEEAEATVDELNKIILDTVDHDLIEYVAYSVASGTGQLSNERSANALIKLIPFTDRDVKSPTIIENLQTAVDGNVEAKVTFGQLDAGPPAEEFPFKVQIVTDDAEQAESLAEDMAAFLNGNTVERQNGTTAIINGVNIAGFDRITRQDSVRLFQVEASFDADDVTALVQSTQQLVEEEYTDERLAPYGLSSTDLTFDFGQESENQESFESMMFVGMFAIAAMYVLLAIQFRSFMKPLLIFMAIPFSLLGVFAGLYYTDNPLSFFVMVGLFGLIGIAVNNTILLTDYANQERRDGKPIIEAISEATRKRFRPLLTTSITTVVALLPLALSDPFWEALAFTIIFGLISSTLLVIISFPYYYLLVEGLRTRTINFVQRKRGKA